MPVKKNTIKKTSTKKKTSTTKAKRTTYKKRGGDNPVAYGVSDVNGATLLSPHSQDLVASTSPSAIMTIPPTMIPTMTPTMIPSNNVDFTNGGAKKKKKRKAGPYAMFVKKQFSKVKTNHPSWKATDCMKEIAKMWNAQKK